MSVENIDKQWKFSKYPPNITRRFEFDSYDDMRQFLDDLADLSEKEDFYPNINFTRTEVSVNIQSDADKLSPSEFNFAEQTDALLSQQTV